MSLGMIEGLWFLNYAALLCPSPSRSLSCFRDHYYRNNVRPLFQDFYHKFLAISLIDLCGHNDNVFSIACDWFAWGVSEVNKANLFISL